MNKLLLFGVLTGVAALLASCVYSRDREPPLVVSVRGYGDGCRVTVEGEQVTNDRLLDIGRGATRRTGIVVYGRGTPYKCVGGTVFTLQRAGLATIDAAMWDDS